MAFSPAPQSALQPIVLFICLGNSCRSIMAEALARQFFGAAVAAASAGIQPLGYVARETLQVLAEAGIPTSGLRSKGLNEMDLEACRLLVNLSGHSLAARMPAPLLERVLQRPVVDPYGCGLTVYRQALDAINRLVTGEIADLLRSF